MGYRDDVGRLLSGFSIPEELTDQSVSDFVSERGSLPSIWGFCGRDLSGRDLTGVLESLLFDVPFNKDTVWGRTGYDHAGIFEKMKNPGLGIRALHKKGFDGTGVNIAVIDKPILAAHSEFPNLAEYTNICDHERNGDFHFHGMACASFACGKTTGTAPGAKLFYYAYPDYFEDDNYYWSYYFRAFDMILEKNRGGEKIRIVSVSAGLPAAKRELLSELFGYAEKMAAEGCSVVFSNTFGKIFTCASRVFNADPDSPEGYKLDSWQKNPWDRERILIPAGGRTSACNSGEDAFVYWGNQSCYSWAIPYLCGVFAIALQINPELSAEDFCGLAKKTVHVNSKGLRVLNPAGIAELAEK